MSKLDELIKAYTVKDANIIPGVALAAKNKSGKYICSNVSGYASSTSDAPALTEDSIFHLASTTKLVTSIAALQCVERGQISLDSSIAAHLPELDRQQIVSLDQADEGGVNRFSFREKQTPITLRHLLTHTSGAGYDILDPCLQAWRDSRSEIPLAISGLKTEVAFDVPLLFEPGESWVYGAGLDWAGCLVSRLNDGITLDQYMIENIFEPLGLNSSTFFMRNRPDLQEKLTTKVTRASNGELIPLLNPNQDYLVEASGGGGLYSSLKDIMAILVDLLQDNPKLLKKETVELLFAPQLQEGSPPLNTLNSMPSFFQSAIGDLAQSTKLNHSLGGLFLVDDDPSIGKTSGTITWAGASGTFWLINRDRGLAAFYASQIVMPKFQEHIELINSFIKEVFRKL